MVMGAGMAALLLCFVVQQPPLLLLSVAVIAAGEVLMAPLLASRIAGDQHGRLVTLMTALWLAASYGSSQLLSHLGLHDSGALQLLGGIVAAVCVVVGLGLAIAAYPLRKVLTPAPEPPPPGTPLPY
jgi:dipeptide/tripeptide permease